MGIPTHIYIPKNKQIYSTLGHTRFSTSGIRKSLLRVWTATRQFKFSFQSPPRRKNKLNRDPFEPPLLCFQNNIIADDFLILVFEVNWSELYFGSLKSLGISFFFFQLFVDWERTELILLNGLDFLIVHFLDERKPKVVFVWGEGDFIIYVL